GDDDSRGRAPGRDGRRTGAKAGRRPRAATGGGVGEDDSWVHLTRTGGTSDLWDEVAADEEAERAPAFDEDADAFVDTPERARALDSALKGLVSRDGRVTYGLKPLHGRLLTAKIKELGNAKRLDAVFQLLDMSAIPTTPNGRKITIGAVIGACVKCEDLDTAYRLLMKLDGPEECGAGAPAYSALMLGYARQGRLIEALGLLEQWERGRGPKEDTPERARALDSALKGLVSRDGRVTYGLKPLHGRLLTAKIKELGNAKRLDAVFQLLDMSAIPTTPNGRKITIGAVIGACVKCEDLDT
ncbi:Pentatricopeptide repeat, partial [Ostreococcus tauri]